MAPSAYQVITILSIVECRTRRGKAMENFQSAPESSLQMRRWAAHRPLSSIHPSRMVQASRPIAHAYSSKLHKKEHRVPSGTWWRPSPGQLGLSKPGQQPETSSRTNKTRILLSYKQSSHHSLSQFMECTLTDRDAVGRSQP